MNRDGANQSLWQDGVLNFPVAQSGSTKEKYDAIIVGGGITGLTTATLLQESGLQCLICEARTLGFGTTSGTTAHLNTLIEADYHQVAKDFGSENAKLLLESLREAISLVERLTSTYSIDCDFERKKAIMFSQDEDQEKELEHIVKASRDAGLEANYTDTLHAAIPFVSAAIFDEQGQLHPTKYIMGLANNFIEMGGVILENCRVMEVDEVEIGTLKVTTERGSFIASNVVYATHIPPGVNILHLRNAPYKSYVIACTLASGNYPEHLLYDMYQAYHYTRTQKAGEKTYLIVGGEDHKTAEDPNPAARFLALENYARKHFDIASIDYKWSSQYFIPADGLPYIGQLPGAPDFVFVATGFGGNGITLSQVASIVLRDLVMSGKCRFGDLFHPSRIKPLAGFANFVKEQADVVAKLISVPFDGTRIDELAEIAPGEGRIIRFEKQKVALYKSLSGSLHCVNPSCSHLRCSVAWNGSEKAWECPCHGSRFDVDGNVLTGPARVALGKIDLEKEK